MLDHVREVPFDRASLQELTVELWLVDGARLRVGPIEAIDGTPVVDIKPVLD